MSSINYIIKNSALVVVALLLGCLITNIYMTNNNNEIVDNFKGTYLIEYANDENYRLTIVDPPESDEYCYYKFSENAENEIYEVATELNSEENCLNFYNEKTMSISTIVYTNGKYYFIENSNPAICIKKLSSDPIVASFIK